MPSFDSEREPSISEVYDDIKGYPPGSTFKTREECSKAGVHAPPVQGIHGKRSAPAFSIVLSGGYEDDIDEGDIIIYTGQGKGIDKATNKSVPRASEQIGNQKFEGANLALKLNCEMHMPVRVIRGFTLNSKYAPIEGYRYDGLYDVVEAKLEKGKKGFDMCRYKLVRFEPEKYTIPVQGNIPRATSSCAPLTAPVPSAAPRNYIMGRSSSADRRAQKKQRRRTAERTSPYPMFTPERRRSIAGRQSQAGFPPISKNIRHSSS